jgi:hypothetical protein
MALTHVTAVRNMLADAVDNYINTTGATDAGGDIIIQTAADATLVTIPFNNPAFGAAASGVITLAGVPLEANAAASGTAAKFRIRDRANAEVLQGTVTAVAGGGDIEADNTSIVSGQAVRITSLTYAASA